MNTIVLFSIIHSMMAQLNTRIMTLLLTTLLPVL